jgi:hypothetical protein
MVSNTQNYWVFGLCPPSGVLEIRKHNVSETDPVFRNVVFSSFYNTGRYTKSENPVILSNHKCFI